MAVHPRFYAPVPQDRSVERLRLGLDPDLPTGLVLFGGYGSAMMLDIMERIAAARLLRPTDPAVRPQLASCG